MTWHASVSDDFVVDSKFINNGDFFVDFTGPDTDPHKMTGTGVS